MPTCAAHTQYLAVNTIVSFVVKLSVLHMIALQDSTGRVTQDSSTLKSSMLCGTCWAIDTRVLAAVLEQVTVVKQR